MRRDSSSVRHSVWSVRVRFAAARNSSGGIIYHASERTRGLHSTPRGSNRNRTHHFTPFVPSCRIGSACPPLTRLLNETFKLAPLPSLLDELRLPGSMHGRRLRLVQTSIWTPSIHSAQQTSPLSLPPSPRWPWPQNNGRFSTVSSRL